MDKKIIVPELLAPAGNMEKLKTAFHFGADAVYLSGRRFGLRAYADNFTETEIAEAVEYAHSIGKKVYVTLNIFASDADFGEDLEKWIQILEKAQADAVIVSDLGVFRFVKERCGLPVHVSTQANTTNKYAAAEWRKLGAERVVLAREVSLADIKKITSFCPDCEFECFVHGAMCISYSGRCLMSNYLSARDGNRGECVQACRWKWQVNEVSRGDCIMPVEEDSRGTYIFNSKDLNMLPYIKNFIDSGVASLKLEGRMKSVFYVATVVNAYRRAIDAVVSGRADETLFRELTAETEKASHRQYTTGFYFDEKESRQYYQSSKAVEQYKFTAVVKSWFDGTAAVEQRNKFAEGDLLEILSPGQSFNKTFRAENVRDADGNPVAVADRVQQLLTINCPYRLLEGDILRKKL